jgi:hypothetical protein
MKCRYNSGGYSNSTNIFRIRLPVTAIMACIWILDRQRSMSATLWQADGHLFASNGPDLLERVLRCWHADLWFGAVR